MSDSLTNDTLQYLHQVETAAQAVLAKKHLKLELANARNKFNESLRALQKCDEYDTFLQSGTCYMRFPRTVAIAFLKQDIQTTDDEINELHDDIRNKVAELRELEHQPGIKGFGLKPMTSKEMQSMRKAFGN